MEFIPNYIDRKHGIEDVKYMQLDLQSALRRTYSKEVAEEERIKMEEDL
jgi:DNA polymerase III alpha subunit